MASELSESRGVSSCALGDCDLTPIVVVGDVVSLLSSFLAYQEPESFL